MVLKSHIPGIQPDSAGNISRLRLAGKYHIARYAKYQTSVGPVSIGRRGNYNWTGRAIRNQHSVFGITRIPEKGD